jgi:hypothetical protein
VLQAIEGIYKDGKVELTERPEGISEGRVIVTFLSAHAAPKNTTLMTFGMFSGANQSTEDDFKLAEFTGDTEDRLDWS